MQQHLKIVAFSFLQLSNNLSDFLVPFQTLFGNSSPDPFSLYMSGGATPTGVASSPIGGPLPKLPPSVMQHQHQITKPGARNKTKVWVLVRTYCKQILISVYRSPHGNFDQAYCRVCDHSYGEQQKGMIISVINLSCSPFPPFSLVSNEPIGFGPEQTFSKEVDDKANAYFQVSNQYTRVSDILK